MRPSLVRAASFLAVPVRLPPAARRGATIVAVLGCLAGCTSDREEPGSASTITPRNTPSAGARCDVRVPATDARNVVTVSDVARGAAGGTAVTNVAYTGCDPAAPLAWRCDLPFPWQTAATTGSAMATLGVRDGRVAYVVTPARSVTETILDVDPASTSGAAVVRALGQACPGSPDADAGSWVRLGTNTVVLATGPVVVALDFEEGNWSPAQQQAVMRAAVSALGPA